MAQSTTEREPRVVVKEVPHAKLYNDGTILVSDVRLAYPHVFVPYQGKNDDGKDGKAKYGLVGLMPKQREYFAAKNLIREHIVAMIQEHKVKDIRADNKFLRDGDLAAKDEYAGNYTISASETHRPIVRTNKRDPKTGKAMKLDPAKDQEIIYGGCWGNILIRPWWMDNRYGKKVNAGLVAVQFTRDDEPFGTGRISEDEVDEAFDDFTDDDSGFDDELGEDDEL